MTIEHINADNPLHPRHAGMMAVLRDKSVCGPVSYEAADKYFPVRTSLAVWGKDGNWCLSSHVSPTDIIAVLPMPDLSGVK